MDATKAEISANWDRAERRVRELETELKNLELAYAEDNGNLRAELAALKATASRAEALERVRIAAANVAAMYQTDPLLTVDGLTDTEFLARINTLRAAIKATCRECDGTGQGEPSWDGEKYSPRDCVKCGGSDAV